VGRVLKGRVEPAPRTYCLFQEPWWLDAVAPGQWQAVEIRRGDHVAARWPYVVRREYGMTFLTMPAYTQVLGPWVAPSEGKYVTRLTREKELLADVIDALPRFDGLSQCFHYNLQNWLPFYWRGWSQTTRYTYVLENLRDEDRLWSGMRDNIRREIRKARRRLEVRDDLGIGPVLKVQALSYRRQGRPLRNDPALIDRIAAACRGRNAGRSFAAVDASGRVHAALYLVWDDRSAYYLMGGGEPELRTSGAHSLVMWEAIRFAAAVSGRFDFEGSMNESIERFFRSFGAVQKPYHKLAKANNLLVKAALALKGLTR
jgi:hypothetical protein